MNCPEIFASVAKSIMLCTRMRLTERRFNFANRQRPISEGPARQCLVRELQMQQGDCGTPRTSRIERSISGGHPKTPLVVLTLSMPPETPTLAPREVKRSPRKQPPFCQQYRSMMKTLISFPVEKQRTRFPEIFIRGVEISDNKLGAAEDQDLFVDNAATLDNNITIMPCDQSPHGSPECIHRNSFGSVIVNLDNYEMDKFGRLPRNSRAPTPVPIGTDYKLIANVRRRTPSPTTRQIIRVNVTANRRNQRMRKFHNY